MALIDDLLKVTSTNTTGQAALNPASDALRSLTDQLDALRGLYQSQAAQTVENTTAVVQNTRSRVSEVASSAVNVTRSIGSTLGGGLTLLPLISGIAKLFGFGGGDEEPAPLTKFALPSAINLQGGISARGSSSVSDVSYGQDGLPRTTPAPAASISVNVQAIDSRSFLDHSDSIARAVREAMLNSHPINDVIAEI